MATLDGSILQMTHIGEQPIRRRCEEAVGDLEEAVSRGVDSSELVARIAAHARVLARADAAAVADPDGDGVSLQIVAASGEHAGRIRDRVVAITGAVSRQALRMVSSGDLRCEMAIVDDEFWLSCPGQPALGPVGFGPAVVIPMGSGRSAVGVLVVMNLRDRPRPDDDDLQVLRWFAAQAARVVRLQAA